MERKAKQKKIREEEKLQVQYDHLSSLPDCLLHHILSFLDTKTLLLTGILSKRWRALTTSFPKLHFIYSDHKFRPKTGANLDNFVRFIDRTLLPNPTPTIKKFTLCFPYNEKCVSHLDSCINFVMQKAIQELDLAFTGNGSYKLPSSLLISKTLISLKLQNCVFGVRHIAGFTKLTALSLSRVTLSNLVLEDLLKGCPLLEDLVMEYFMCCTRLKIGSSSLRLKRLTIKVDHYVAIDVEAPNLQFLNIDVADFGHCSFKEMLFLRDAYFNASCAPSNRSEIHSLLNLSLHSLRHAGFLVLSSGCLQVMPIPTFQDLPSSFFKTKSLIIKTGIQIYEIPGIAYLLWSSPDLENLIINLRPSNCIYVSKCMVKYDFDEEKYWESLTATFPCLVHHLKTITITGFMGEGRLPSSLKVRSFHEKDEQLKLVKFLIKNSKVLQKMTIHVSDRPKFVKVEEWTKVVLSVAQKLLAFPRASSHAEILFSYK